MSRLLSGFVVGAVVGLFVGIPLNVFHIMVLPEFLAAPIIDLWAFFWDALGIMPKP
jgi:hypothetical protein